MSSTPTTSPRVRPRRGSKSALALTGMLLVAGLTFLPTTMIVLCGMLPTIVAFVANRDRQDPGPLCIGSTNLLGVLPFLLDLWTGEHSLAAASAVVSQPLNWVVMYSAAAIGAAIGQIVPAGIAAALITKKRLRLQGIVEEQDKLIREWGKPVSANQEMRAKAFFDAERLTQAPPKDKE